MEVLDNWKFKINQILLQRDAKITQRDNTLSYILNKINQINSNFSLLECTSLGSGSSQEGPVFSWKDPDAVKFNNITLTEWDKTILVRKIGSYPENYLDGEIIAMTSYQLENKNYYLNHSFVDTTQQEGNTYYYKLFSKTKADVWNNLVQNQFTNGTGLNWYQIQSYVRAGRGEELFPVGTVFYVNHPEYTHQDGTGIIFRVAGHDQIQPTNQNLTHSMCLEMAQVIFTIPYDNAQLSYALTQDNNAKAGKTYYTYDNSNYTALTEGSDYQIGDNIPTDSWYQKNIQDYAGGRVTQGSNNPKQNNLIQWANSDGNSNNWFIKQTIFDVCNYNLLNKNGFLKYLDEDFKNVVQNANIIRAKCTAEGGGYITFSAKFFPLSQTQVFNTSYGIEENQYLKYYEINNNTIKYLMDTQSPTSWWIGTPNFNYSFHNSEANNNALGQYCHSNRYNGVSLACIIA